MVGSPRLIPFLQKLCGRVPKIFVMRAWLSIDALRSKVEAAILSSFVQPAGDISILWESSLANQRRSLGI
jgi:hypothetical protein